MIAVLLKINAILLMFKFRNQFESDFYAKYANVSRFGFESNYFVMFLNTISFVSMFLMIKKYN